MELIIFLSVMTVIVSVIAIVTWIDIFRHPEQTGQ